jgi:hypothetical protein
MVGYLVFISWSNKQQLHFTAAINIDARLVN